MTLKEVEDALHTLSRGEKAQLLQWVARDIGDAFPGIDASDDVLGGEACIARTRIPVWMLVQVRREGLSEADILKAWPTLTAQDLANAWAYARANRDEIERDILENAAD